MNAQIASTAQIDVGEAFGYSFRTRHWFGKLAVIALCVLFFWVLLIPAFILVGYFVEAARRVSQGRSELPPWTDIGQKLADGFLLTVALVVWGLPGTILTFSGFFTQCAGSACFTQPGPLAPLGGLYSLLIGLLTATIWSQYLDGGFVAAFDFRAVFRRALQRPGLTVTVWLLNILAIFIALAGFILVGIGFLFTLPYAYSVTASLYGQFKQRTDGAVAPAL